MSTSNRQVASGQNGLGSRSGANYLTGFIGGQKRLMERFPKRGFNNAVFAKVYVPVNLALLDSLFADGDTVDGESLKGKGLTLRRGDKVKILGNGEITKKLTVKAQAFSKSAQDKLEKAGGTVEVVK